MSVDGRRAYAAAACAIVLSVCVAVFAHATVNAASASRESQTANGETSTETRALWVLRSSLASPQSIATLVASARDHAADVVVRHTDVDNRDRAHRFHRNVVVD